MFKIIIISAVFPPEPMVSASISFDLAESLSGIHEITVPSPAPSSPAGYNFSQPVNSLKNFKHIELKSFILLICFAHVNTINNFTIKMIAEDCPKDFQEFLDRFKSEDDCWKYLFSIRWPDGFCCPKCNNTKYYLNIRKEAECSNCGHQLSITAGTIFHGTRKPLNVWFHVMWWVAAQKTGVSASNFKDFVGFGSYEKAWAWRIN